MIDEPLHRGLIVNFQSRIENRDRCSGLVTLELRQSKTLCERICVFPLYGLKDSGLHAAPPVSAREALTAISVGLAEAGRHEPRDGQIDVPRVRVSAYRARLTCEE